ncbi:MAG: ribbon-helix-helix protein, CopG family [Verrucomicrobia bacterium]|nr:ribbon-helix-helix protein, CopG family [Verrucomicrobiota bacterium]
MSTNMNTKATSKAVLVLVPRPVVEVMDRCVKRLDLDRSKFIRAAIREKLQRDGAVSEN